MTAIAADRGWGLDAPGSLLPWLTTLWRDLRKLVAGETATKEQREMLLLLDYAASHHGEVLLDAADIDDLDDRLDALLRDPQVFHWNALATRLALGIKRDERGSGLGGWATVAKPILGEGQIGALEAAAPLLDACVRAHRALLAKAPPEVIEGALAEVEAAGPEILTTPLVPPEIAGAMAGGLHVALCTLAIARAVEQGRSIEPWLARGLVERFVIGARRQAAFMAGWEPAEFPESILPASERLDLPKIVERHRRARERAEASYLEARARLVPNA